MILSKLKPVFSKMNFQKSIPNLRKLFPKPFSKAEKIYDYLDDMRYYASHYISAYLAPSIVIIPRRTFYNIMKKEIDFQYNILTELCLLLKKYEEKLIIAKYPEFINELDNYGITENLWGTNYYGPMLLLKQLQETEPEKYGSFEDDQKICDFLKIYDSSKMFYLGKYQFGKIVPIEENVTKEYIEAIKQFTCKYSGFEEINDYIDQNFNEALYELARKTVKESIKRP